MRDFSSDVSSTTQHTSPKTTRVIGQNLAHLTNGAASVSTLALTNTWALHLMASPDKQLSLAMKAQENWTNWLSYVARGCPDDAAAKPTQPKKDDRRFLHESWSQPPFAAAAQAFLLAEDFADHAATEVPGLGPAESTSMTFLMRQMMDVISPSNFLMTNPEALEEMKATRGHSLVKGSAAFVKDWHKSATREQDTPQSRVGDTVALSEGKVVLRTHLMELIQYAPTTETVHPEPILIVPAWIMKYYILDLSPHNSLVRYLTGQGFTVFMISWRNPHAEDADLGMADYLHQGPLAALNHISATMGAPRIHTAGYCLGGTLLSIAAAHLSRVGDTRLASMTLLAAQTDFTEAGELMLFINESQVAALEDTMGAQGYLDASQMMSAFQMLRSNDLIWSRLVRRYLLGEEDQPMNELMAWNADSTRMPARMHSEYLRHMFLNNDLAAGRYTVDGHTVSLRDIRIPIFGVGTETDHIAPWTSAFKIHTLSHADVTFVLTNGGHNAGVISEPGHAHRHFRIHTTRDSDQTLTPETWMARADMQNGSWWPAWTSWLTARSGKKSEVPAMTGDICDAPGTYVFQT